MNKISINLNPHKESAPSDIFQNIVAYTPYLVLGIILCTVIIGVLQVVSLRKAHVYRQRSDEWQQWKEKSQDIRRIKEDIARLEAERTAMGTVMTPQQTLARILGDIFSSLPKNAWFESIQIKEDLISVRGYVVKWGQDYLVTLDTFINALRDADYFAAHYSQVNIKDSQTAAFNTVEVLQFSIECQK